MVMMLPLLSLQCKRCNGIQDKARDRESRDEKENAKTERPEEDRTLRLTYCTSMYVPHMLRLALKASGASMQPSLGIVYVSIVFLTFLGITAENGRVQCHTCT
jgi:transcriptional antiterminator Rof (Rho-off)